MNKENKEVPKIYQIKDSQMRVIWWVQIVGIFMGWGILLLPFVIFYYLGWAKHHRDEGVGFGGKTGFFRWLIDKPKEDGSPTRESEYKPEKEKNKERILEALETRESIANNDVEELLGVSDATASRYLSELEEEGKLEERGEGSAIHYVKSDNE